MQETAIRERDLSCKIPANHHKPSPAPKNLPEVRTKRQVSAAHECRKQRFGNVIESERHAARLELEPPFDEGREAIARHGGSGSERTSCHGRLMRTAAQAARRMAAASPRHVLERPSRG